MKLTVAAEFAFSLELETDLVMQFQAAETDHQSVSEASTVISGLPQPEEIDALDSIGNRLWVSGTGDVSVSYHAKVEINRSPVNLAELEIAGTSDMTGEAAQNLFDSTYCPVDRFRPFVETEFEGTEGGNRVAAIRDWINEHFDYMPGTSTADTTALESFVERRGVCRDYAHVLITMCRASGIPARYVACYGPHVDPPDFHAVVQVFLKANDQSEAGRWYLVDATDMAKPQETVIIGVGRDAGDVSFLTSFGPCEFRSSSVSVSIDE